MDGSAGLAELEPAESLALLRTAPVGRIVFTEGALPAVQPVNFLVHGDTVVIRTAAGAKLSAATNGVVVAFEADEIDVDTRQGWSVTIVGHARVVTDLVEEDEMRALPLETWAPGQRSDFIRIQIQYVTGRRLTNGALPT